MNETISAFLKTLLQSTNALELGAAKEETANGHCRKLGRGATEREGKLELGRGAEHQRSEGRPPAESLLARWGRRIKGTATPAPKKCKKTKMLCCSLTLANLCAQCAFLRTQKGSIVS